VVCSGPFFGAGAGIDPKAGEATREVNARAARYFLILFFICEVQLDNMLCIASMAIWNRDRWNKPM
jgi:hypothetical protein